MISKIYYIGEFKATDTVSFSLGQRGCTHLRLNGYTFVKNRRSGYKTYWICSRKGSTRCRARVATNIIDGVQKLVFSSFEHNHPINVKRKPRRRKPLVKAKDTVW